MGKKYDAVSIGLVVQDIILRNVRPDALYHDTTFTDECLVTCGGDACNEAVTMGRLGDRVAPLFRIGCDSVGSSIYAILQSEPLDLSLIIRDPGAEMMLSTVIVKPDGERSFICKKANEKACLSGDDITDEILKNTRAVTVGSLYCLPGLDGEVIADVLRRAQGFGAVTLCDMAADMNHIGPNGLDCVFPHVDYMLPSLEEAEYTTGESEPEKIAGALLQRGVKNVVLKLGEKGCYFKNREEEFYCSSFDVKAVDTTGCGDNFVGGFTHAILKGFTHRESAEFASACGGLNATQLGAHHAITGGEAQIMEFMRNTPKKG